MLRIAISIIAVAGFCSGALAQAAPPPIPVDTIHTPSKAAPPPPPPPDPNKVITLTFGELQLLMQAQMMDGRAQALDSQANVVMQKIQGQVEPQTTADPDKPKP